MGSSESSAPKIFLSIRLIVSRLVRELTVDTKLSTTTPLFVATGARTAPENCIQTSAYSFHFTAKKNLANKPKESRTRPRTSSAAVKFVERASVEARSAVEVHRDQRREITRARSRLRRLIS